MRIVKIGAEFCGMCKVLEQKLKDAEIDFESVDAEKSEEFVVKQGIKNLPVVIVFDEKDREVKRFNGLFDVELLRKYM